MSNDAHLQLSKRRLGAGSRDALVLYGSETGNAQDVAEEVGHLLERFRFDTAVMELDSVQLRDIVKPSLVVFVLSTTGQGEMPQNARRFWKALLSSALKPQIFKKLHFTSFGLGDSSYARYNVAHRMLCSRLTQLGAQSFCERGEGNEQHPEGHSAGFREWVVSLQNRILEKFPLADGVSPIAEDKFVEPKFKLIESTEDSIADVEERALDRPGKALLPRGNAYLAHIEANDRITPLTHFQDVRLLDLRLQDNCDYGPGAITVIYPKNFPVDVDEFIRLMRWETIADIQLHLQIRADLDPVKGDQQSPLRHLDLSRTQLTLRWLLENVFDIMSIPKRSFFASLAYFASETTEDEAYQKTRLLELANPELIDELWDYTTRPKRTILEVMSDFTTIQIPWQYAFSVLPVMKGRQFSIASGAQLAVDEQGRTRVQLLVAIADPPSPIIKYKRRYGVCTRYISTLEAGQQLRIGMQPGYLDVRPQEIETPALMIGPGTGLAPMRSMIYQRLVWAGESKTRGKGKTLAGDVLVFGCRNAAADYFFKDEWQHLADEEGLTVFTAFSRDSDRPREYVQDKIRAHAQRVYRLLEAENGKIYVCGSSGNMPRGVREALVDVAQAEGRKSRHEAETWLDQLEKEGRYKQETW